MRILLTNDDGITAPGLKVLEGIAARFAPEAELWIVAPAMEQSGVGHCITYTRPLMAREEGERRISVEGTPADCVLVALEAMEEAPDLILSGVNRGNNSAENTVYSGTLGAAMEGALQGIPSIGLSQYWGPRNGHLNDPFEAAAAHAGAAIQACLDAGFDEQATYPLFYNINLPPVPATEVEGLRATTQGRRRGERFSAERTTSPTGRTFLWVSGGNQRVTTEDGSDAAANLDGYVSITPMRADLCDRSALSALEAAIG
ncbi:MAG: 5'/3'-nucleotidase SurE [Shimia sp.]